jgi:anti-sigma B factor antagonist
VEHISGEGSTTDPTRADGSVRPGAATSGPLAPRIETDAAVRDTLSLAYRRNGPEVIVEVHGELDLATAGHLETALVDLIDDQGCCSIVLDLHGLDFIGSKGLSLLLKAQQHAQSKQSKITLARPSPAARRTIEMCGLLSTFDIRDRDGAAASHDGPHPRRPE